jgi:hypothetical protein
MSILNNVAIQWLIRRVPDWGGQITFLVSLYLALPQEHKDTINAVLSGQGGGLTVSAVIGLGAFLYAQVISFRQTTKPKEVEKIAGTSVEVSAPRKSLWDILKGK